MHTQSRFHYIDNLRCIALLLGIAFHAALAYGPYFRNVWFTADTTNHVLFNYFANWSHLFRMPLFFVIAGFCAALLISKRGSRHFIKNRFKRVLLPFFIFIPLVFGLTFHAITWGLGFAKTTPAVYVVFEQVKDLPISTGHLWFLWNLMQFCLLFWLLAKNQKAYNLVLSWVVKPLFLCTLLPTIITISMLNVAVPFPPPDKLYPELWSFGFYGLLFLVGAGLFEHKDKIAQIAKQFHWLLLLATISTVAYFYVLPPAFTIEQVIDAAKTGSSAPKTIAFVPVITQTIAILSLTAVGFIAGYNWLNVANSTSRYLSDASYWLYLIHVPVLLYIQFALINLAIPALVKFLVSISLTMIIGLITYHFLVRNTAIGVLLNGKRIPLTNKSVQAAA